MQRSTKANAPQSFFDKSLKKASNATEIFINFLYEVITTPFSLAIDIVKTFFKSPSELFLAVANLVLRTILNVVDSSFKIASSIIKSYDNALKNIIDHIQGLVLNLASLQFDKFLRLLINTPKLLITNIVTEPLFKLTSDIKELVTEQYEIVRRSLNIAADRATAKLPSLNDLENTDAIVSNTIRSLFKSVLSTVIAIPVFASGTARAVLELPASIKDRTYQLFNVGHNIVTNLFKSPSDSALAATSAVTRTVLNVVTFVFDVPLSIVANTYKSLKNTVTHAGNLVSNLLKLNLSDFLENVIDTPRILINNILVAPLFGIIINIRDFVGFQYDTAETSIRIAEGERRNQDITPILLGCGSTRKDLFNGIKIPTSVITSAFYEKGLKGGIAAISAQF